MAAGRRSADGIQAHCFSQPPLPCPRWPVRYHAPRTCVVAALPAVSKSSLIPRVFSLQIAGFEFTKRLFVICPFVSDLHRLFSIQEWR